MNATPSIARVTVKVACAARLNASSVSGGGVRAEEVDPRGLREPQVRHRDRQRRNHEDDRQERDHLHEWDVNAERLRREIVEAQRREEHRCAQQHHLRVSTERCDAERAEDGPVADRARVRRPVGETGGQRSTSSQGRMLNRV